jgi:hypothetical protein
MIKRCRKCDLDRRPMNQQKWCLFTKDGSRLLGRHSSRSKAIKQEQAIEAPKITNKVAYLYTTDISRIILKYKTFYKKLS